MRTKTSFPLCRVQTPSTCAGHAKSQGVPAGEGERGWGLFIVVQRQSVYKGEGGQRNQETGWRRLREVAHCHHVSLTLLTQTAYVQGSILKWEQTDPANCSHSPLYFLPCSRGSCVWDGPAPGVAGSGLGTLGRWEGREIFTGPTYST